MPVDKELRPLLEQLHALPHTGRDPVLWCPPDVTRASTLRVHLELAGVTRRELHEGAAGRSMHMTAHDLRSTGMTWAILRGDDWGHVRDRAGHSHLSMTDKYVREAQHLGAGSFGTPFPPLPESFLREVRDGLSASGVPVDAICPAEAAGAPVVGRSSLPSVSSPAVTVSSPTRAFPEESKWSKGGSNP